MGRSGDTPVGVWQLQPQGRGACQTGRPPTMAGSTLNSKFSMNDSIWLPRKSTSRRSCLGSSTRTTWPWGGIGSELCILFSSVWRPLPPWLILVRHGSFGSWRFQGEAIGRSSLLRLQRSWKRRWKASSWAASSPLYLVQSRLHLQEILKIFCCILVYSIHSLI